MATFTAVKPSLKQLTPILHHAHHFSFSSFTPIQTKSISPTRLTIRAINAAQSHDYEPQLTQKFTPATKLKIAIIGFGNFGQFLAKSFIRQGHTVFAYSRSNYQSIADSLGAAYFTNLHDLCEQHADVILFCTAIISTESVLESLPLQRLRKSTLFVDVLSVKEDPKNLFLRYLPPHFDILCTHPMFGPQSGKNGWKDLKFVFEKVRIGNEERRVERVECFLDIFVKEGCRMVEMSCEEHDKYAAETQFTTHTVGRILMKLQLERTPIDTKGYESLVNLKENTSEDSFDLYVGLFRCNKKNAMEVLEKLDSAFEELKEELFGRLDEVSRKQLFGKSEEGGGVRRHVLSSELPKNRAPLHLLPSGASQEAVNKMRFGRGLLSSFLIYLGVEIVTLVLVYAFLSMYDEFFKGLMLPFCF